MGTKEGVAGLIVGEERREEERLSGASWSVRWMKVWERDEEGDWGREKTNKGTGEEGMAIRRRPVPVLCA